MPISVFVMFECVSLSAYVSESEALMSAHLLSENPFESNADHIVWELPLSGIKCDWFGTGLLDIALEMILEILTDSRQMVNRLDPHRIQVRRVSDPAGTKRKNR